MKIPEARWKHLLSLGGEEGQREAVKLGYTAEDYKELRDLYRKGKLPKEYIQTPDKKDIPKEKNPYVKVDREKAIKLYKEGKGITEISKIFGCHHQTIRNIISGAGIVMTSNRGKKDTVKKEKKQNEEKIITNPIETLVAPKGFSIAKYEPIKTEKPSSLPLDIIADQLNEEELKGYVKGNVINLIATDLKAAGEILNWYNSR